MAAPAASVRQLPAKTVQATKPRDLPAASGLPGLVASCEASATPIQAAPRPLIVKHAADTNRDRFDDVMLNRIDVKDCDS